MPNPKIIYCSVKARSKCSRVRFFLTEAASTRRKEAAGRVLEEKSGQNDEGVRNKARNAAGAPKRKFLIIGLLLLLLSALVANVVVTV